MLSHGVDPKLELGNMPEIVKLYERVTRMNVSPRQPYAGDLVFTAFSGSHQDAISKGMACKAKDPEGKWNVPYLPIDPVDVGRTYDSDVIRINSQSGKGGVSYILKQNFGLSIPEKMREEIDTVEVKKEKKMGTPVPKKTEEETVETSTEEVTEEKTSEEETQMSEETEEEMEEDEIDLTKMD